jgi:hypothetical protein
MLEPVVDRTSLLFTQPLVDWLLRLVRHLPATQRFVGTSPYTAAIPATSLVPQQRGVVAFLRVNYLLTVTRPASGSGQVVLTLRWTDTTAQLAQSTVLHGTVGNVFDLRSVLIHADCNQPIMYDVAYTSSGTTPLQYTLDLVVEQVNG